MRAVLKLRFKLRQKFGDLAIPAAQLALDHVYKVVWSTLSVRPKTPSMTIIQTQNFMPRPDYLLFIYALHLIN